MIRSLYISYNGISEPIVQSQVIPYLKELSKKGIKFFLLTYEKEKSRAPKNFYIAPNITWYRLKYHKNPTIPATIFDIFIGCIYCFYIILRNKVDVVHARAVIASLVGFPAARFLSKKFIFDTRGIDSEEYVDAGSWPRGGLKHKIVGFLEGFLTKHSDHIVVLTKKFKGIFEETYPGKRSALSVIPCAVDTEKFKPSEDNKLARELGIEDKSVIVYSGSLGTWYMLAEMIDFFECAVKLDKNVHFLILTQTDKEYVTDLIQKKGLDASSVTVDTVRHGLMPAYLSLCTAGIFFIKPVFSKLSSSPVKFGEYLLSGLPVIINKGIGDTEEIVRENRVGIIVENFDKPSYNTAFKDLNKLREDRNLAERCRVAAGRHLSLKGAVDKYADIYKRL